MAECKHHGCPEPPVAARGRYAGLCEFHVNQRKHFDAKKNGHLDDAQESVSTGGASPSLAELAAAYETAIAAHVLTGEEVTASRTRLSAHPLFADLTSKAE